MISNNYKYFKTIIVIVYMSLCIKRMIIYNFHFSPIIRKNLKTIW